MTDPRGSLERLAEAGGTPFPNLLAARERTRVELERLRGALADVPHDPDAAVVLMGSWGRAELTGGSDDDYMLLVDGPERDAVRPAPADLAGVLGSESREPGPEGVFGDVVFAQDLQERIGLAHDSNANMTRRLLLLLESVPASGAGPWASAREGLLRAYLATAAERRPPRFFLNDVFRYWRTIAVDFEGKDRTRGGEKWGLRSAKLRTSRKLLFASGLVPILECHNRTVADMALFLAEQFAAPPTDRLAGAFLRYDAVDPGVRTLGAYDRFLGLLGEPGFREHLESLTEAGAAGSEEFAVVRELADELQAGLLALLFEDRRLYPLIREYGIF
ncbi:MAG: hypothetical protein QOE08_1888 [Thermoleophilaceae bacterium]|jgi:hypothetical protein|nr:hypothetical protein [Thermoleophilaceae bacterium]